MVVWCRRHHGGSLEEANSVRRADEIPAKSTDNPGAWPANWIYCFEWVLDPVQGFDTFHNFEAGQSQLNFLEYYLRVYFPTLMR